jgi:CHAT domain-containing protein
LSKAYEKKGDFPKAEQYLKKCIDLNRKNYGDLYARLANDFKDLSDFYARKKDWDKCLSSLDTVSRIMSLPKNIKLINFDNIVNHKTLLEVFKLRGYAYFSKAMFKEAYEDFEMAISLSNYLLKNYSSKASKSFTLDNLRPIYELATKAAFQLNKNNTAIFDKNSFYETIFKYTENSKATLLYESLLKYNPNYKESAGIPEALINEEAILTARIDELRELIYSAQQKNDSSELVKLQNEILDEQRKLQAFDENLSKKYPDYKSNKQQYQQSASIDLVRKSLKNDELLIEYLITDSICFIFYITKEKLDLKIIEPHFLNDFRNAIKSFRSLLTDLNYAKENPKIAFENFQKDAFKIFNTYVDHPFIEDKKNLIIITDRELNYIPFEVLLSKKSDFKNQQYDSLPYLIKTHSIRYEYSATVMLSYDRTEKRKGNGRVMGFAPEYQKQFSYDNISLDAQNLRTPKELLIHKNLSNLEGAKKELEMLKKISFGDFYFGQNATEKNLKILNKKEYSVAHFAMHGVVDLDRPSLSSLVFTEDLDSLQDNLLYSYEINHLDFSKIELVVLSACQTGYGKYELGEGVVSIGRSFMHAGASSVVSTLWELNDFSAAEIMNLFYKNISKGMSKDLALRNAKLEYLRKNPGIGSHPFFWAGLIQFGDPSPLKLSYNNGFNILYMLALSFLPLSFLGIWYYFRKRNKNSQNKKVA